MADRTIEKAIVELRRELTQIDQGHQAARNDRRGQAAPRPSAEVYCRSSRDPRESPPRRGTEKEEQTERKSLACISHHLTVEGVGQRT